MIASRHISGPASADDCSRDNPNNLPSASARRGENPHDVSHNPDVWGRPLSSASARPVAGASTRGQTPPGLFIPPTGPFVALLAGEVRNQSSARQMNAHGRGDGLSRPNSLTESWPLPQRVDRASGVDQPAGPLTRPARVRVGRATAGDERSARVKQLDRSLARAASPLSRWGEADTTAISESSALANSAHRNFGRQSPKLGATAGPTLQLTDASALVKLVRRHDPPLASVPAFVRRSLQSR